MIRLAITVSMALLVVAIGMRSTFADTLYLLRRPWQLVRSLAAMNVIAPLLAIWLMTQFNLQPPVKIALFALSLSPVPPVLPNKQLKLVHAEGFAIGLFVATSIFSIVIAPAVMTLVQHLGYVPRHLTALDVMRIVVVTALLPLLLGMGIRALWPAAAERYHSIVSVVATVLLVIAFLPILIGEWSAMGSLIGDGTLLVIICITVLWLIVGHILGGPRLEDRSALALATAARHPAVAIAVASASFPQQKLAPVAVLLAFLVATLVSVPYAAWRRKVLSRADHEAASVHSRIPP
jgi:BASS family bile acid:Na+ symporter